MINHLGERGLTIILIAYSKDNSIFAALKLFINPSDEKPSEYKFQIICPTRRI